MFSFFFVKKGTFVVAFLGGNLILFFGLGHEFSKKQRKLDNPLGNEWKRILSLQVEKIMFFRQKGWFFERKCYDWDIKSLLFSTIFEV